MKTPHKKLTARQAWARIVMTFIGVNETGLCRCVTRLAKRGIITWETREDMKGQLRNIRHSGNYWWPLSVAPNDTYEKRRRHVARLLAENKHREAKSFVRRTTSSGIFS